MQKKSDLKNASDVEKTKFAKEVPLVSLKSDVDKLDINKLEATSTYLGKLNKVVENHFVKSTVWNKLLKKDNTTQTKDASNLVKKTEYDAKVLEIEKKKHGSDKYLLLKSAIS